jgi:SPP1 family predicted phage head-tail adaptor
VTAPTYDPGRLRHRIVIEAATATGDGAGGETLAWSMVAALWARIEPAGAAERAVADHLAGVVTHEVTIRWRDGVGGGMRVAYRGRHFRFLAVHDPDESRRYLVLAAEEETT